MDMIREEDGFRRAALRKQASSASISRSKLLNKKQQQQPSSTPNTGKTPAAPILISTKLATSTHINSQLYNNNTPSNDLFENNNHGEATIKEQSTYFQQSTDNIEPTPPYHSNFLTQTYNSSDLIQLPKRVINTKISPTFKAVVNSLIAEKLLNYCKEYEFFTDSSKNQLDNNNGISSHIHSTSTITTTTAAAGPSIDNFIDNSSTATSKTLLNDGSVSTSSMNLNNKRINFTSTSEKPPKFNPSLNTSKVRMMPLVNNYTTTTTSILNDESQPQLDTRKEIKFKKQQQQQQSSVNHDVLLNVNNLNDFKIRKAKSFNSIQQQNAVKTAAVNLQRQNALSFKSTLSTASTTTTSLIRPATSVIKSSSNNTLKRQTPASVKRKNLLKKKNKIGVAGNDEAASNKETVDGGDANADDDEFSYFSASEIVMKSRSYENFNYNYTHQPQQKSISHKDSSNIASTAVSSASTVRRQQQQQQAAVYIAPREPLPQYAGRWTDMAVNYYINNENTNDDNDEAYQKSRHPDFDYISSIFKIRRYNLSDAKELEKAKNDLFKRYSFVNDPYIKSRLSNSSSSLSTQQPASPPSHSFRGSNMSTTNNSRLSMATTSYEGIRSDDLA